jgi:hypothetical protein
MHFNENPHADSSFVIFVGARLKAESLFVTGATELLEGRQAPQQQFGFAPSKSKGLS